MIIFFGPAGAGKSVQGQLLAARHGWRWLSAGQMLRDTHNRAVTAEMTTGELVDSAKVNVIVAQAMQRAKDISHVVLDGFPRELSQAKWLIDSRPEHGRAIGLVVVLDVPPKELLRRLQLRGRADDTAKAIEERLAIYHHEIEPILHYFSQQNVPIVHISGADSVNDVHERIESELRACSLV